MGMPRYAARRDENDSALKAFAERLGWYLIKMNEPSDYLGCKGGRWFPIEIKNPDCRGHADEFTAKQLIFHRDAFNRSAPVLIWYTDDDVLRDSGARRTA